MLARLLGQLADTGPLEQHRQRERGAEAGIDLDLQIHRTQ
jgi:hypothetical protein